MELMKREDAANGLRVEFVGLGASVSSLGDIGSSFRGKAGTIVYGISEDIFCYPDELTDDMVWVAFDEDRLPRRQVSLSLLNRVEQ